MKNIILTSLRAAALSSALFLVPAFLSAKDSASADPASQMLATSGTLTVKAAGPYVEVGSYRIHVSTRLGRPTAILADGTWLYRNFTVDESAATGTLVVRFEQGRVSQLSLASPKVETALLMNNTRTKTLAFAK